MINSQAYIKLPPEDKVFLSNYINGHTGVARCELSMQVTPATVPLVGDRNLGLLITYAYWICITQQDMRYISIIKKVCPDWRKSGGTNDK